MWHSTQPARRWCGNVYLQNGAVSAAFLHSLFLLASVVMARQKLKWAAGVNVQAVDLFLLCMKMAVRLEFMTVSQHFSAR